MTDKRRLRLVKEDEATIDCLIPEKDYIITDNEEEARLLQLKGYTIEVEALYFCTRGENL